MQKKKWQKKAALVLALRRNRIKIFSVSSLNTLGKQKMHTVIGIWVNLLLIITDLHALLHAHMQKHTINLTLIIISKYLPAPESNELFCQSNMAVFYREFYSENF